MIQLWVRCTSGPRSAHPFKFECRDPDPRDVLIHVSAQSYRVRPNREVTSKRARVIW
jgi:hypothetical protein